MNKKIALFSCHDDPNYGSMLQAYALVAAIRKLGKDAEYLMYSTDPDPSSFHTIFRRFVKRCLMKLGLYKDNFISGREYLETKDFEQIMLSFKQFHQKFIPVSNQKYYFDTIKHKLDFDAYQVFVVGSDQTWSPFLYTPRKPYFLDFAMQYNKCSYAPSLGTISISSEYMALLKEKLSSFHFLSCREKTNAIMLSNLLNRKVEYVLDPTLLLDKNDWDIICKDPCINEPYILAYILGEREDISRFAESLGKKESLPVYYMLTTPTYLNKSHLIKNAGPAEFVGLIKNASYVVTDSFHGSLFSINYNKEFFSFSKKEGGENNVDNVRIKEFLSTIKLTERYNSEIMGRKIDYTEPNKIINNLRTESYRFLSGIVTE